MTINDLIRALSLARSIYGGHAPVTIVRAWQPGEAANTSAIFPIIAVDSACGINIVQSNQVSAYIAASFPDFDRRDVTDGEATLITNGSQTIAQPSIGDKAAAEGTLRGEHTDFAHLGDVLTARKQSS